MVIEFSGMVIEFSGMVIEFRWIVIEIRRKLVKLQLILMNGHQNHEQIGQNNQLQTLFHTHSNILSNCNWFRWMVIEIRNNLVETITSKHYFTLTPIYCHIGKVFRKIHHLQTLFHTLQNTSSQAKLRVWESEREKKGRPSFENSMNGHFSACGIRREFLDNLGTWLKLTVYSSS